MDIEIKRRMVLWDSNTKVSTPVNLKNLSGGLNLSRGLNMVGST